MPPAITTPSTSREPAVDPALQAIIGSADAPARMPPSVAPPHSLPGSVGALAGVWTLFGMVRSGMAWAEQQRARHGDIQRSML
ncbi:MAG TPA: hypothetical protein VFX59_21455 [Polyangiales bacterium]|nr:hypothetical protein [Polyangiales bacterium]